MRSGHLILVTSLLIPLGGCPAHTHDDGTDPGPVTTIVSRVVSSGCSRAIDYSMRKMAVSGVEIPITLQGTGPYIKIGAASTDPMVVQQASSLVQALDLQQFSFCQQLQTVGGPERVELIKQYNANVFALLTLALSLQNATTPQQQATAVKAATVAVPAAGAIAGLSSVAGPVSPPPDTPGASIAPAASAAVTATGAAAPMVTTAPSAATGATAPMVATAPSSQSSGPIPISPLSADGAAL